MDYSATGWFDRLSRVSENVGHALEPWRQKLLEFRDTLSANAEGDARSSQPDSIFGNALLSPDVTPVTVSIPAVFAFKPRGVYDFDSVLGVFDWTLVDVPVSIDLSECRSANYQALSLIVIYAWKLKANGCRVSFKFQEDKSDATKMWKLMGGSDAISVLLHPDRKFASDRFKPMISIRSPADFKHTIATIEKFTENFNIEYMRTLRQVLSELLYNTMEHGSSWFNYSGKDIQLPGICQFTWYETRDEIHFIVADAGMGIRNHLGLTYTGIADDAEAVRMAIRAKVSGTFARNDPYQSKDNAGMGLYISTNIIKRLGAEMHIVSGKAAMHLSPRDVTVHALDHGWPGTFALVAVKLEATAIFELHQMMQEFREAADEEQRRADGVEEKDKLYVNVENYFGINADVKDEAVNYRNKYLIAAAEAGHRVVLDFRGVLSSPHSFLSALIATPITIMGMSAYKKIKIVNATSEIRETLDFILDENTNRGPLL